MKLPNLPGLSGLSVLPTLGMPALAVPKLGLASFRRRIIFRGVFVLLGVATLALAVVLLKEEKQRSYQNYAQNFARTQAEVLAKLRHPAGQLALLNASFGLQADRTSTTALHPLVLPFSALDFDDQNKAQQAVEMAGCSVRYPNGSSLCVAVGNNAYSGGFIYLVGRFDSGPLVARERGQLDLNAVHRARVSLEMRGQSLRWIAPFEVQEGALDRGRGRLTGFVETGSVLQRGAHPVRDFRAWLWQNGGCLDATQSVPDCARNTFFSIRLPVDVFRDALFQKTRPVWPPQDLDQIQVRMEMLVPGSDAPLFDSNAPGASIPFALDDLAGHLLPGETLHIHKQGGTGADWVVHAKGQDAHEALSPWLNRLVQLLPVEDYASPRAGHDTVNTAIGSYDVQLLGDLRSIDRSLGVIATRVSWYVLAMLGAIGLAWLVIEVGLIRRITVLTRRAAAVSFNVQDAQVDQRIAALDLSDLRGADELGILAGGLHDLLQRVKDDVQREQLRAQQERDMWHAVGHEIMSPLQSLMVLHSQSDDASHRYVRRMQQAVRVLYGSASPSEAIEAAALHAGVIDLNEFLHKVASNAHFAGLEGVQFALLDSPVMARADEFSLEDVVTHILTNAQRYRRVGTPITMALSARDASATIYIHNQGDLVAPALLESIFEYGVSDPQQDNSAQHRGQGLFVAKTYMAKMGGTIAVRNVDDGAATGVVFVLTLQRVS